jgi:hypothetical protein
MHFGARSPTSSNGIASGPYADPTKEACQALDIPCLEDGLYINTDSYTFDKGGLAVLDISGYIENDPKYTLFAPTFLSGNYIIGTRFQHGPQDNLARINKEKLAWGPRLLTFVISDMYD